MFKKNFIIGKFIKMVMDLVISDYNVLCICGIGKVIYKFVFLYFVF